MRAIVKRNPRKNINPLLSREYIGKLPGFAYIDGHGPYSLIWTRGKDNTANFVSYRFTKEYLDKMIRNPTRKNLVKKLPGYSSEIKGARKIGWRERVPKGWHIVKEGRYYNHIKPLTEQAEVILKMGKKKNTVLRASDKQKIRKEVSTAIKAGRTVPYDLRTLIESGISLDRIRKVYRKKNPESLYQSFHGVAPVKKTKVYYQPPPKELYSIGEIRQLNYQPRRGKHKNVEFYHRGGDLGDRIIKVNAILATDMAGKNLYIVKKSKSKYPIFSKKGIIG